MTLRAQQMKSVTNLMENVFAQAHTMETNANLDSIQFQALFKNLVLQNTIQLNYKIIFESEFLLR